MGKAGSVLDKVLHRRIQETYANSTTPSLHQIVDTLRGKYPEYRRQNLQRFTRMVRRQTLDDSNHSKGKGNEKLKRKDSDSRSIFNYVDDELSNPMCKKAKTSDHMLETRKQVAERRIELQSSDSKSFSSSESGDGEEEDRSAVSSSKDDDVYSFETELDLTKSMLRNKYSGSKLDDEKTKSVELEGKENNKKVDLNRGLKLNNLKKDEDEDDGVDANRNGDEEGPMFKDFGGMEDLLNDLKKRVIIPLYHPELPRWLGVRPTLGILLHGPPGCGKTTLAHAIANETGFPFYQVAASELVSGISGASEKNIRELFAKAYRTTPSIVFIDEIDAIASKRENQQREMERRIVTQLMACMDQSHRPVKPDSTSKNPGYVLVIGATNRPDVLDPALRRPGRFDREIELGVPDQNARFQILKVLTRDLRVSGDFDLGKISRATPGFVGADLARLVDESGVHAMMRIIDKRELELSKDNENWWKKGYTDEDMEKLGVRMLDFEVTTKTVQPSSKREGFSIIPNVTWEDVGGLDALRMEFDRHIVKRIKYPDVYENHGVDLEMGFLLYGPPGCGKTLIAKAVANAAGANFIYIKGPEILKKYVGDSESEVRAIFSRARTCSPCILFFDEVDALTTSRGKEGGWVVERLLNQLLVELDGADQRKGVYVIGATNRRDMMDRAILRAGRMGIHLYVPLPNPDQRVLILKALARKKRLDADVDLDAIGRSEACANFSGADLCALMNKAAIAASEETISKMEAATATDSDEPESSLGDLPDTIKAKHFEQVLGENSPSVSDKLQE